MKTSWLTVILPVLVVVAAVGYWSGCSDFPAGESPSALSTNTAAPAPGTQVQSFDDLLAEVGKTVPAFGGLYIAEDGALEVIMTDRAQEAMVEGVIRSVFPMENLSYTGVRVRDCKYPFTQLKGWYDVAYRGVFEMPGVAYTDIDERANRLVVGITEPGVRNAVAAAFKAAAVPDDALEIQMTEPVRMDLRNRRRPLVGGLQTSFSFNGTYICTIGYIANRAGIRGIVINSHCSGTQGGVQNVQYHQAVISGTTNRVGLEIADPNYFVGGVCPAGKRCRRADVAFARVPHPSGPSVTSTLGRIARTAEASFAWNGTSLWTILGKQVPTFMGETVKRVGRTTGTRTGVVNGTCVNIINISGTNVSMLCQAQANYISGSGDSGSPVFRVINAGAFTVAANGIHWGTSVASGAPGNRFFSTINYMDAELGVLTIN